jgi:hypothetical protein
MYRCPDDFDDGLAIGYRSTTLDISECLTIISEEGRSFDIVLVDSWHEFEPSWRDLVETFRLIRANGMLVVHDCLPPRPEVAVLEYIPGEWCGVSYQAYVDFIARRPHGSLRFLPGAQAGPAELDYDRRIFRQGTKLTVGAIASCEDHPSFAFTSALALAKSICPA